VRFIFDLVRARERELVRRRFEIALAISLVIHAIAVWLFLTHDTLLRHGDMLAKSEEPLSVRVAPSRPAVVEPPQAAKEAPPAPAVKPQPPRVVPRRPTPPPPVMTAPRPAPPIVVAPQPPPPTPPPPAPQPEPAPQPQPPMAGDLASYIEQRRRARGESGEQTATVDARDRAIAQNLASINTNTFGELPRNGGGTFQIRTLDYDNAQFTFFGWNKDISRRAFQVIDVRKGDSATIELAVVRKIISIIRDHEPGDFVWHSIRLARDLTLSARPSDNAELESFMMQEFFTAAGRPR
jgi:outer membrane biosynthesis protein TonB